MIKPRTDRVTAKEVAAFLNITETTVYSLCRGVRGWQRIKPLPHFTNANKSERQRYTFDLKRVAAWVAEIDFKVQVQGRRKLRRVSLNKPTVIEIGNEVVHGVSSSH